MSKKKKTHTKASSGDGGGALMGLRGGFQKLAGTKGKRGPKMSFMSFLGWLALIAAALFMAWRFGR
jgi:hypothetical protein